MQVMVVRSDLDKVRRWFKCFEYARLEDIYLRVSSTSLDSLPPLVWSCDFLFTKCFHSKQPSGAYLAYSASIRIMARGRSGKKSSLKAALSSQQSRLKKKEEATHAARLADRSKDSKSKDKGKARVAPRRSTIPFNSTDRILLIGEGNFSFTRALVSHPPAPLEFLPAQNVTASAYDTEEECYSKYPDAEEIVKSLRMKGADILFGVDATKLEKCTTLKGRKWDKIVWNFPHAGEMVCPSLTPATPYC